MENHVWAVWDFMSLVKALQKNLTCLTLPWIPPQDRQSAYLLNSIVLGEESDDLDQGDFTKALSHYELYLDSMKEVGCDTIPIQNFIKELENGKAWEPSLKGTQDRFTQIAPETIEFVEHTMNIAIKGSNSAVAAAFLFGREDPIPKMFQ